MFITPLISAPEKFLVNFARFLISISLSRELYYNKFFKWILNISSLPLRVGNGISSYNSNLPGLSMALSIRSILFVRPITMKLFIVFNPSISDRNVLTMESFTKSLLFVPLYPIIHSNSSMIIMWNPYGSFLLCSNNFLIFSSLPPTYLFNNSGPDFNVIEDALRSYPIFFAIKVLPVPGGPYKIIPLICSMLYFLLNYCGNKRDRKTRR